MSTKYNLNRLTYFVATVEAGSITAGAKKLGVSKAVVSKQLQQLEQSLGTNLLIRNTRHITPSAAGEQLYREGKAALLLANQAFDAVLELDQSPKGKIRITAPVDYGLSFVAPKVAAFQQQYPQVEVDLNLTDDKLDLVQAGFDIGFRIGWLPDSGNLARKIQDFDEVVVCSSQALSHAGIAITQCLTHPNELTQIPYIANTAVSQQHQWLFHRHDESVSQTLTPQITVNITHAVRSTLLAGTGFSILPDFLVAQDLRLGRLVRLLPDWRLRTGGVYTLTPPSRLRTKAVNMFLASVYPQYEEAY